MTTCKYCEDEFEWAFDDSTGRWVPLVLVGHDSDLPKVFRDSRGNFRADHRALCKGRLTVTRLQKPIMPLKPKAVKPAKKRKLEGWLQLPGTEAT